MVRYGLVALVAGCVAAGAVLAENVSKDCKLDRASVPLEAKKLLEEVDAKIADRQKNEKAIEAALAEIGRKIDALDKAQAAQKALDEEQEKKPLDKPDPKKFPVASEFDAAKAAYEEAKGKREEAKKAASEKRAAAVKDAQAAIDDLGSIGRLQGGGSESENVFKNFDERRKLEDELDSLLLDTKLPATYLKTVDRIVTAKDIEPARGSKKERPMQKAAELAKAAETAINNAKKFASNCGAALTTEDSIRLLHAGDPDTTRELIHLSKKSAPPPATKAGANQLAAEDKRGGGGPDDMGAMIGEKVGPASGSKPGTGTGSKQLDRDQVTGTGTTPDATATAPKSGGVPDSYTVAKNDTLGKIALKFAEALGFDKTKLFAPGGLVEQLYNALDRKSGKRDLIFVGQIINIKKIKDDAKPKA